MRVLKMCFVLYFFILATANISGQTTSYKPKVTSKSPTTSSKKTVTKAPRIKFLNDKIDFGTIKEDSILEQKFEFTNIGNADLVIINATGSCGCTIPLYPNTPIKPGDSGSIIVKFTAKNKFGPQKPIVTVTTNSTPRLVKLQLDGWVEQVPGGVK